MFVCMHACMNAYTVTIIYIYIYIYIYTIYIHGMNVYCVRIFVSTYARSHIRISVFDIFEWRLWRLSTFRFIHVYCNTNYATYLKVTPSISYFPVPSFTSSITFNCKKDLYSGYDVTFYICQFCICQ